MRAWIAAIAALTLVTGCAADASDGVGAPASLHQGTVLVRSTGGRGLNVTLRDPVKVGKTDLEVTFTDPEGLTLEGVSVLMPAHGHGSPPPTIEQDARGYVVSDVALYMSGRWELRFALRASSQADEAVAVVDVP